MTSHKEEFRALMKKQLDDLHKRIAELEDLAPHPHEHSISWDTVVGECRRRHLRTAARLRDLDVHCEETWHATGADIRNAVEDLRRDVAEHEERTSK